MVSLDDLESYARVTFILVLRFLHRPQSRGQCFTYRGLRNWLHYNPDVKGRYEWHTIERGVRRLAELGVLRRARRGRKVVFCPGRHYHQLKLEYLARLREHGAEPPRELRSPLDRLGGAG